MAEYLRYPVYKGNKLIGYYTTYLPLMGIKAFFYETSFLKQRYDRKIKYIEVPIRSKVIFDNHVEKHYTLYLDVTRKSKRQIDIILNNR